MANKSRYIPENVGYKPKLLIGIAGKARSGKNTIADFLLDHIDTKYKAVEVAFAGSIKAMIKAGLGLGDKDDLGAVHYYDVTYRRLAQTLGTEWGRDLIHRDIWLKSFIKKTAEFEGAIIIPDVRFENEAGFIRELDGIIIHVDRPDQEEIEESDHKSERPINKSLRGSDYICTNSGTLEELEAECADMAKAIEFILEKR